MKTKIFGATLLAALALTPAASAGKLDHMRYEKETIVTLGGGKSMKVTIVKMKGHMMALVPVSDLEALLSRAEGHSMTIAD